MSGGAAGAGRFRNHASSAIVALAGLVCFALVTHFVGAPSPHAHHEQPLPTLDQGLLPAAEGLNLLIEGYTRNLDQLGLNMKLQALFIGLAVLLAWRGRGRIDFLGAAVPVAWLHLLAPGALLYLWMEFGFTMNHLIEQRHVALEMLARTRDAGQMELGGQLFRDYWVVDGWFLAFETRDAGASAGGAGRVFWGFGFALFAGAAHACTLVMSAVFSRRFLAGTKGVRLWCELLLPLILLVVLIASHLEFAYVGRHPNWIQLCVAGMTPLLCIGLSEIEWRGDRAGRPEGAGDAARV